MLSNVAINTALKFLLTNEISIKIPGNSVSGGGGAGNVWCSKICAPGDFDEVQLFITHSSTSATTTYQSIISVTETASQSSDINRWRPVVGGVEYSTLNANDAYGWKPVSWGGAPSFVSVAGSTSAPAVTVSDWIPIHSVPRADGGFFPLIHVRTSALGGTTSFAGNTSLGMYTPTQANNGFICQSGWGADATGLMVSAPSTNNPVGAMSGHMHSFGIRFRTRKPGISILCVGDSLTQNSAVVADSFSSFGLRAAAKISSLGIPCGFINAGFASQPLDIAATAAIDLFSKLGANALMIQGLSPNGPGALNADPFARDSIRKQAAIVANLVNTARIGNAIAIISTGIPSSAAVIPNESQDAYRRDYNSNIKSNAMFNLDWDTLVSNIEKPARIKSIYQYDDVHPNELFVDLQGILLANKLRAIFGV